MAAFLLVLRLNGPVPSSPYRRPLARKESTKSLLPAPEGGNEELKASPGSAQSRTGFLSQPGAAGPAGEPFQEVACLLGVLVLQQVDDAQPAPGFAADRLVFKLR